VPRSCSCALFVWCFCANLLSGAVIRGSVVENQTGKPLARAAVTLQPVAGTPGGSLSIRTNSYGAFAFDSLAGGAYVIKASKRGFMPAEYGQKQWNSAGTPVFLTSEAATFLTIRLPRYGAITGTIVDENDVGLPQQRVLAYRSTQPPQIAGQGTTDDRGVFRVSGLEPGAYLVRTAAGENDGVEYLPTFSKETLRVDEAQVVQVYIDEESKSENVRPAQGTLFTLKGTARTNPLGIPVTVTLISDMGRQSVPGPDFQFQSLPPGPYELYAEAAENRRLNATYQAVFTPLNLNGNQNLMVSLQPVRESRVDLVPDPPDARGVQLLARRKDLAGVGPAQMVPVPNDGVLLAPGRWELSLAPPTGFYVSAFSGLGSDPKGRGRADAWNEISFVNFTLVKFSLSPGPGSLHGTVKANGDLVAGAPVYLETYDPDSRKRLTELRTARTDLRGSYRFDGLAPGTYRVLATFEYQAPDSTALDLARARQVEAEATKDLQMDLDLYSIR